MSEVVESPAHSPATRFVTVLDFRHFLNFLKDESGQDLIEYGLVATLLSLCAISMLQNISTKIVALLQIVVNGLTTAA